LEALLTVYRIGGGVTELKEWHVSKEQLQRRAEQRELELNEPRSSHPASPQRVITSSPFQLESRAVPKRGL
jgi:hypothetical protein